MEKGHYGHYSGNAKHSRVTNYNMDATKRDDEAHMEYLKEDVKYDNKHGHSDSSMTADEKHISKLAGDLKYDEKHHGAADLTKKKHFHKEDGSHPKIVGPGGRNPGYPREDDSHPKKPGAAQNGDIIEAPNKITQTYRRFKNDQTGPYSFARNLATTALALAPIPLGKLKAVKNIASAFGNTSKQYLNLNKVEKAVSTSTKTVNVTGTNSLKTMYPPSKFKSGIGVRGPLPSYTRSAEEVLKPKVFKSKPVEFMGPNPAYKTGAGGNSYPGSGRHTTEHSTKEYMARKDAAINANK